MPTPVPFAEPAWLMGLPSPYYKPTHREFQRRCRTFVDEHLSPYAVEWERDEIVPPHLFQTFAKYNMLIPNMPAPLPADWLHRLGVDNILGVPVEEWDYFHTGIYLDEMLRNGLLGPPGSMSAGHTYGIPPIVKFGSKKLQDKFLPDLLLGKRRICLAVTEAGTGSDVARITTTAERTPDGKYYLVNGDKKWITNGIWSDYATLAVRTGGPGAAGLSIIICPLQDTPGVTMRRLKVQGQISAGTTYIAFDDVKVPVENLVGQEGLGMQYIMTNFNHERLTMACNITRSSRVALSSAMAYVLKREAFGKTLIEQPVVRHRLAQAGAELEMMQAWLESMLYSVSKLSKAEADKRLGGLTALLKAKSGMVLNECAQVAVLLFGGNGYTRTGQGEIAEKIYREVMGARIPGGSEDVLLDLAVRQLVKIYERESARQATQGDGSKL